MAFPTPTTTTTTFTTSTGLVTYTGTTPYYSHPYTLAPQTTAWIPPESCRDVSISCGVTGTSTRCYDHDILESTRSIYIDNSCYPKGYTDIIYHNGAFSDAKTLAFPGTACPQNWFPACTTTISSDDVLQPQTLCCPEGYSGCASDLAGRNCFRKVSTATAVWTSKGPTLETRTEGSLVTTITTFLELVTETPSSNSPLVVYRAALPLRGTSPATTDGSQAQQNGQNNSGNNTDSPSSPNPLLSPGAIAGVAIGAVVGITLLMAGLFILLRRRRAAQRHKAIRQDTPSDDGRHGSRPHTWDPFAPADSAGLTSQHSLSLLPMHPSPQWDPKSALWESPASVGVQYPHALVTPPPVTEPTPTPSVTLESDVRTPSPAFATPAADGLVAAIALPLKLPSGPTEAVELESHPVRASVPPRPVEMDAAAVVELSWMPTPARPYYAAQEPAVPPISEQPQQQQQQPPLQSQHPRHQQNHHGGSVQQGFI